MVSRDEDEGRPQLHALGVVIGLREVYDELRRMSTGYERLDAKLDATLGQHGVRIEAISRDLTILRTELDEHEHRIRQMEQRPVVTPRAVWTAIGVIVAIVGVEVSIVTVMVPH